jgi:hypothetical protein
MKKDLQQSGRSVLRGTDSQVVKILMQKLNDCLMEGKWRLFL